MCNGNGMRHYGRSLVVALLALKVMSNRFIDGDDDDDDDEIYRENLLKIPLTVEMKAIMNHTHKGWESVCLDFEKIKNSLIHVDCRWTEADLYTNIIYMLPHHAHTV